MTEHTITNMKKTREQIQNEALQALKDNNYTGTVCLSTGAGKSFVAIQAIKESKFKNILITSPRTNLKENWKRELYKWGIFERQLDCTGNWMCYDNTDIKITIENIQTVYKWGRNKIINYDLIIVDEIHFLSHNYTAYLWIAKANNIPIIGLTATPTKNDEYKREVLYKLVPIVYEYYHSEDDGIINKVNYYVWEYELNDEYKILAGNKTKQWLVGEKKQYEYLTQQYEKAKKTMFLHGATDYFLTALQWMRSNNTELKKAGVSFFYAIKNRKDLLWNLNSSATKALVLKQAILSANPDNKVLLFSELTKQADKLSPYSIHSNTGNTAKQIKEYNKDLLDKFNSGEIRELSSCISLTLGLNLTHANWAIFESYSGSETNSKQKKGRNLPIIL